MATDALGDWEHLGTVLIDNQWRLFPVSTVSEIFRITTTVGDDWNKLLKSAAYIRFYYPDGNKSEKVYIRVENEARIKEILIPTELKSRGFILRDIGVICSHPKKDEYSLASFARWTMKIEALL
ncbi:MAG: hypothetical protein KME40_32055 [Komarekiella atlantica HA4396-MV6]|jgi:hypothetical protein|nr:hypothetical protein [Komarekiella atlantica HA4396-MV6]